MTQQKSENPIVPEGLRKSAPTRTGAESPLQGGGKGIPVDEMAVQPDLPFATAENPETNVEGANGSVVTDRSVSVLCEASKAKGKKRKRTSTTIERVIEKFGKAWTKVASNRGAPGPDGKTIDEVRENLTEELRELKDHLKSGEYQPGEIRRVLFRNQGVKVSAVSGFPT